ncbi:MAG: glycosyltransferase [Kouleothrix sp.]|nr:glycosyltransferase [Kouleothrix sp.]
MIFLNAERFIGEAISSVLAQSYPAWELLLVDDGSTDGSTAIAREYAGLHPDRMRYLEHAGHQNRGMSASRNLGAGHARGDYIALLDADDAWLPHKLDRQVAILDAQPSVGMLYGPALHWYSWTGAAADLPRDFVDVVDKRGAPPDTVLGPPRLAALLLRDGGAVPSPCSIIVRRTSWQRVGGFEETFRDMYEDQAFYIKLLCHEPAYIASECLSRYRQHPAASTTIAKATGQERAARARFLSWAGSYLAERGVADAAVWRALRRARLEQRYPAAARLARAGGKLAQRLRGRASLAARRLLRERGRGAPPVGRVRFGSLRRLTPISRASGFDRGQPIDRYYIERFLACQSGAIRGRVLEIGGDAYTRRFGGERVTVSDVLHVDAGNPRATIVADLARADHIPSGLFDCIICTQTLQYIYDAPAAVRALHRILKPGGVILATVPAIGPISRDEWSGSWCWGFTAVSARKLFEEAFAPADLAVEAHGNVLAAVAFLQGLAVAELTPAELDQRDPLYQVLVTVRAVRRI